MLTLLGESIDVTRRVRDLSTAEQQMVEIAKAISRNVRILILDEPTAPLTDHEINGMFAVLRRLKAESVGIIYISHRLEEIFEIGDRVTVLRDGLVVGGAPVGQIDRQTLIRWMVGRELAQEFPPLEITPGQEILRVENLSAGFLKDISWISGASCMISILSVSFAFIPLTVLDFRQALHVFGRSPAA